MVMQTQKMNRKFLREIDSPFSCFLCHFNILFIFRVLSRLKGLIEDEKYEIVIDECSKIIESSPTEKYHIEIMQNAVLENCCAQLHRAKHNRKSTNLDHAKCCAGKLLSSIT